MSKRIAVIGGGMAGTAAAHELLKLGYQVTIIEQNDRLGGRIHTMAGGGATFELGAGFMTNLYTNVFQFLKETGSDKSLRTRKSQAALVRNGKVYRLSPANLVHNRPILIGAQARLLMSFVHVLRKWRAFDPHEPWHGYPRGSRPVSAVFSGRYGREADDYFIQPIFDGYCYWNTKRTSEAMWTLMCKLVYGPTYILPDGLSQLPESAAEGCRVLLSHTARSVSPLADGTYSIVTARAGIENTEHFDGVVCATTAIVAKKIIKDLTVDQEKFLSSIHYTSTVVLARVYKLAAPLLNQATAYPRKDGGILGAVTISSHAGATSVKIFASGAVAPSLIDKPDGEIRKLLTEAAMLPDYYKEPTFEYMQRWPEALPEFTPEQLGQLRLFAEGRIELETDGLVFAGDYIGGPYMDGAFWSGVKAAQRLHSRMNV